MNNEPEFWFWVEVSLELLTFNKYNQSMNKNNLNYNKIIKSTKNIIPGRALVLALTLFFPFLSNSHNEIGIQQQRDSNQPIVFLLDDSISMWIVDLKRSRFEVSKETALRLAKKCLKENKTVGLSSFASTAVQELCLTGDIIEFKEFLLGLGFENASDGTSLGIALAQTIYKIRKQTQNPATIVLITDGNDNSGKLSPEDAIQIAVSFNIKIFCIGIGREGKGQFTVIDRFGKKRQIMVDATVNFDLLEKIAAESGGLFIKVDHPDALNKMDPEFINNLLVNDTAESLSLKQSEGASMDWFFPWMENYEEGLRSLRGNPSIDKKKSKSEKPEKKNKEKLPAETDHKKTGIYLIADNRKIRKNDNLFLKLVVVNIGDFSPPQNLFQSGAELIEKNQGSSFELKDGKSCFSRIYWYNYKFSKAGLYRIPPIHHSQNGKDYQTKELIIEVIEDLNTSD